MKRDRERASDAWVMDLEGEAIQMTHASRHLRRRLVAKVGHRSGRHRSFRHEQRGLCESRQLNLQ
jgi:hypothetical protein